MTNVLIRGVPEEDLALIRSAATERDMSLQNYLLRAIQAQAVFLRRQAALARTSHRLRDKSEVPEEERAEVLDAIDAVHEERAEQLSEEPPHR